MKLPGNSNLLLEIGVNGDLEKCVLFVFELVHDPALI